MLVHPLYVVEMAGSAATGGNDHIVKVGGAMEQFLFDFAEGFFAISFEEDGNGGVEGGFEHLVKVKPLVTQTDSELVPDGGLAAVHVAYEVDAHGVNVFAVVAGCRQ